jgi:hypothetical protein
LAHWQMAQNQIRYPQFSHTPEVVMVLEKLQKALDSYHEKKNVEIDRVKKEVLDAFTELVKNRVSTETIGEAKTLLKQRKSSTESGHSFFERYKVELLVAALSVAIPAMDPANHHHDFTTKEGQSAFYDERNYYVHVLRAIIQPFYTEFSHANAFTSLIEKSEAMITQINLAALIADENQQTEVFSFEDQHLDYYKKKLVESGLFTFRTTRLGQDQFVTESLYSFNGEDAFRMQPPFAALYLKSEKVLPNNQTYTLEPFYTGQIIPYEPDRFEDIELLQDDLNELESRVSDLELIGRKITQIFPLFKRLAESRGIQFLNINGCVKWKFLLNYESQSYYVESDIRIELEKHEQSSPTNFSGSALSLVNRLKEELSPSALTKYAGILELPAGSSLSAIIQKVKDLSHEFSALTGDLMEFKERALKNKTLFELGSVQAPSLIALIDYLEFNENLYYSGSTLHSRESHSPLINDLCTGLIESRIDLKLLRIFVGADNEGKEEVFTSFFSMGMQETLQKTVALYASIDERISQPSPPKGMTSAYRSQAPFSFRRNTSEIMPTAKEADVLQWPNVKFNAVAIKNK